MIDAAWEHLGVPCVYLLGRPQLLFQYFCISVCMYFCISVLKVEGFSSAQGLGFGVSPEIE